GSTVRIAFADMPPATPPPYDIVVLNTSWNTLATASSGAVISYALDAVLSAAINVPDPRFHIACPDDYSSDIWSLACLQDANMVRAHTRRPSGMIVNTMLSVSGAAGANAFPVVSYGMHGEIIVYGWLSSELDRYIATQLRNDGTTFLGPV